MTGGRKSCHRSRTVPRMHRFISPGLSASVRATECGLPRSDAERGYTGNSFWNVEQIDGQSMTLRSQDGQLTRRLDLNDPADRHTDLGYAVTAYGAQGASARFVITLEGTEGGRKRNGNKGKWLRYVVPYKRACAGLHR